tara:strand:- start:112 stop:633 length:522 start_codon:yes stop_codon:yes gene_type:complete
MSGTTQASTSSHPFSPQDPRPLAACDLAACLALDQQALGGFWSQEQWLKELEHPQRLTVGRWDLKQCQLLSLASGWLVAGELQVMLVAVQPNQQRRGLGRQVLQALLLRAQELDCSTASLEVAASNQAAINLYEALGFINCGQRSGYYRNGEDALLKCLDLKPIQVRTDNRPE